MKRKLSRRSVIASVIFVGTLIGGFVIAQQLPEYENVILTIYLLVMIFRMKLTDFILKTNKKSRISA
ncbi:hypothetical protein G8B50_03905 [Enterococcus durans]|uniref:hypothetical protein n=1 Tax=Enterococcus durans TaxID=53345 RepID=UPI001884127B|nr:hypothetical protein [Enterococcus durans]MBE9886846.1 hypothetical protein [Enterococcus durans]